MSGKKANSPKLDLDEIDFSWGESPKNSHSSEMKSILDIQRAEATAKAYEEKYGKSGGRKTTKLESRTVKELQALCAKRRIVYSGLRKAELVAALRKK